MFVIQGSARANGNTEFLTNVLLEGIKTESICLRDQKILPIVDQRHEPEGFSPVDDDFEGIVKQMLMHDEIVLATPLYWYGMSSQMKTFIDRWSQALRNPALNFKEQLQSKKFYVVVVGGPGARQKGLPLIQQFTLIFNFIGTTFEGYLIGEGAQPGTVAEDELVLAQAKAMNKLLQAK